MLDFYQAESLWECLPDDCLEAMTLCVRTTAGTATGADIFTNYSLFHVRRLQQQKAEDDAGGVTVANETCTFHIYTDDLVQSGYQGGGIIYPSPFISYQLISQSAGQFSGSTTNASAVISSIPTTAGILPGMGVIGGPYITPGSTVQSVSATSITLSQPATGTGTIVFTAGDAWEVTKANRHKTRARWDCEATKAH